EHPALDQPGQVGARRRGGDAGFVGERARWQRAAVTEREQDPGPAAVGHERSDARDVGIAVHGTYGSATTFRSGAKRRRAVIMNEYELWQSWCRRVDGNPRVRGDALAARAGQGAAAADGPDAQARRPPDPCAVQALPLTARGRARADRDLRRRVDAEP